MSGYAITITEGGQSSFRAVSSAADLLPGETFALMPPEPTLADAAASLSVAVQSWLDATARANGYDSLASCISYLSSSIAQYADDAVAALAWRDAVWPACFQWQQDALANPPATLPSAADVIASLPQPAEYGWVVHAPGEG